LCVLAESDHLEPVGIDTGGDESVARGVGPIFAKHKVVLRTATFIGVSADKNVQPRMSVEVGCILCDRLLHVLTDCRAVVIEVDIFDILMESNVTLIVARLRSLPRWSARSFLYQFE
jgi:hypothetical protein